jgi:hypothetical protein
MGFAFAIGTTLALLIVTPSQSKSKRSIKMQVSGSTSNFNSIDGASIQNSETTNVAPQPSTQNNPPVELPSSKLDDSNISLSSSKKGDFQFLGSYQAYLLKDVKKVPAPPPTTPSKEEIRRTAFDIAATFESQSYGTTQTRDSGIVSYGRHQATLASGTLEDILTDYTKNSKSETAKQLSNYMDKVKNKDESLRTDKDFLKLLKEAAKEPEMVKAQDFKFTKDYWEPANKTAISEGLKSPLASAILFDTNVNGGMQKVLNRTKESFPDGKYTEQEFLGKFLDLRKEYMLNVAEYKRKHGDKNTANDLESAADYRISSLKKLVDSGNLDLKGEVEVHGQKVRGASK